MSKTTPDDVCALCYHHKSEAATCNREDCELSPASPCSLPEFRGDWDKWLESRRQFYSDRENDFMRGPISMEERIGYLEQDVDALIPAISRLLLALEANAPVEAPSK